MKNAFLARVVLARAEEQAAAELERARREGKERARGKRTCVECGRGIFSHGVREVCGECAAKARDRARPGQKTRERTTRDAVLAVLARHDVATVEDIEVGAEVSQDVAHHALSRLVRAGLARRVGVGRYVAVRS